MANAARLRPPETDPQFATTRVLDAVAEKEDVRPVDLKPPLYEAVEPDALNELFRGGSDSTVEFRYLGYRIRVTNDDVTVTAADD